MKLYGKNPILERLKSNPQTIRKIFVEENHVDASYIRSKAKKWNIPVFSIDKFKMQKMGQHHNAQGMIMDVADFEYAVFNELLDEALEKNICLVFLDNLNDPQNLGAMIRSFACLGGFAVVLPTHGSVGVTEAVMRIASGGENYVKVAKVANLNNAISSAKKAGFTIAGTVVKDGDPLMETELPFPLALVVGSEQKGIRDIVRQKLDLSLSVPMAQERLSLNAAHAAAIFAYEITKQKNQNK